MEFYIDYSKEFIDFHESKDKMAIAANFVDELVKFLVDALSMPTEAANATAKCLLARMSDRRMRYHTPVHILTNFQFAKDHEIELDKFTTLAFWFHDAICEPAAKYRLNETRSGEFCESLVGAYLPTINERFNLSCMIGATASHHEQRMRENFHLLLDLDLCSFAYNKDSYVGAIDALRLELGEKFDKSRKGFLKKLIKKGFLYRTQDFSQFEDLAYGRIQEVVGK